MKLISNIVAAIIISLTLARQAPALELLAQASPGSAISAKDQARRELEDALIGQPASKLKTKSCQVRSTGAKHRHVGKPGSLTPEDAPLPRGEFRPHVYVFCSGSGTPYFLVVPVTPATQVFASQALSIIGAAHLAGKWLHMSYDPEDTSGPQIGCVPPICRQIVAIQMVDTDPGE